MKINCHNTFDPLQEVILGNVNLTILDTIDNPNKRHILEHCLYDTIEDLENISKIFQQAGITVLCPSVDCDYSKVCRTPWFETIGTHMPLTPRDILFTVADKLIATFTGERSRFFEQACYTDIFNHYLDHDSYVISMPMPTINDMVFDDVKDNTAYYNNQEALIDAANIQKYGKDILISGSYTANPRALKWVKKIVGDNYRIHVLPAPMQGHIDAIFNILKPGVVSTCLEPDLLPDFFKGWQVIQVKNNYNLYKWTDHSVITDRIQDDDYENTILDANMFSIDENTVLVYDWTDKNTLKQLEKAGITPVPVSFRHAHFLNQGITCLTLDTVRKGNIEDYQK